jgi:hypothetical protein
MLSLRHIQIYSTSSPLVTPEKFFELDMIFLSLLGTFVG